MTNKILLELQKFDKGGLEKVVLDSAVAFDRRVFEPIILSIDTPGTLASDAERLGIRVLTLNGEKNSEYYAKILDDHKIKVVLSHFSNAGYEVCKQKNIPNIAFIHNIYAFLNDDLQREFLNQDCYVTKYISVSQKATEYATQRIGITGEKIVTIPNGIDVEEHQRRLSCAPKLSRSQFGLLENDFIFVNVASYNLHKGHFVMADAMKKILQQRSDIKILCVGNEVVPWLFDRFRSYLQAEGLDKWILLPGYYKNVESFLDMADAFLLPSFIEGWSIALNEALLYGLPFIATDVGGASEILNRGEFGIVVPNEYGEVKNLNSTILDRLAWDTRTFSISEQLADAMLSFAANKEYWQKRGAAGAIYARKELKLSDAVLRYQQVIQEVVSN